MSFLLKQYFEPTPFFGMLFNPFYIARRALWLTISKHGNHIQGKTLDVGCGTKPYERLFNASIYVGLEIEHTIQPEIKKADVFYDGKEFPFDAESFDSIVSFQVLEHVFEPDEFLREINRVLKPGGKILFTLPFVWDEHEQPYDYARYTSFGVVHLLQKHGFKVLHHEKTVEDLRVLAQLLAEYIYKKVFRFRLLKYLSMPLLIFPVLLLGSIVGFLLPGHPDLYLDHVIVAKKT